jgi:biotin carboxyl carrier protein
VSARPERSRAVLVEIGGRERRVEVNRAEGGRDVSIDGRPLQVDVAEVGGWVSLLVGPGKSSYRVAIDDRGDGELIVHVNGIAIPATVRDPRVAWRARGHEAATATDGRADVRAPMPGRVVKLLVKAGDVVTARQGLVVVEAMKMENELRAPKDGRVADIRVKEGMSVEANAVLITVE